MSIVSALFSSRRSSFRINARIAFLMDNLFAIAFGLGLRFVVHNVSNHDFKLTGTLVGLWEGVITLHFLKKMPNSIDPYIAYVVRLFVDFLVTENIVRLVLVVVWTGLGMVLADIAPAIWHDVGGHRVWRRFRRDMYYMSRSVPTVTIPPLFPRARVVRFSPVIQPTEISETLSTLSPTAATPTVTSLAPATRIVPPTPPDGPLRTRRVPGGNVSVFSETNSDGGSVAGSQPPASVRSVGSSHVQYTVRARRDSIDDSVSQAPSNSVDDSNLSSAASSTSTETPIQPVGVVEEEEEIEIPVHVLDKGKGKAVDIDTSGVAIQPSFALPPTPSDSNRPPFEFKRASFVPTITGMPSIPDFPESGLGSDWENIKQEEVEEAVMMIPPTPPEKDFDSRVYDSPPAHFIPPPASSVYEPTPRPSTFDQDLWDGVSNTAPSTPYMKLTSEQRTSRLPQPSTSMLQRPEARVSQPVKKRKSEPPLVPQTPVYGDVWDTERDQIPPTPSVLATTPMFDNTVDLNESVHPASEPLAPVAEQGQDPPGSTGPAPEQQGPIDFSFGTDDPWDNLTPPVQPQDEQQRQSNVPQTPQIKHTAPPTPRVPTQVPPTPQQRPGTVPPTPQTRPGTVPPTPSHRPGTVPSTPHHPLQPIPPTPPTLPQEQLQSIPPTPGQASRTVPPTPGQKPKAVPSTPQTKVQTVPPTPQQQSQLLPSTPQQQPQPVLPISQQQPQFVPPTPQQQPQPVPPTPGQKTRTVPPTPLHKTKTITGTPQQPTHTVTPTSGQRSRTVPSTPLHQAQTIPPTPVNKARTVLPTPQYNTFTLPPDSPPPQLKPIPPEPIPISLEQTQNVPPTPQPPVKTISSTPQQPAKTVPPTPQSRIKTVPPTPQQQRTTLPTPQSPPSQAQNLFDDFLGADLGDGSKFELQDFTLQRQQQQPEGDLLDLGTSEVGVNEEDKKSPEGEGAGEGRGEGRGEDSGKDYNSNNDNKGHENENGEGNGDVEGEGDNGGDEVQIDNNPMSPASSAYSSVAGVATEIKERNKQAIILRAQIHELTRRIDDLKDEKLGAEGREELDPSSGESALKEQEIQKAERSLEKMKKRAEKRYQAAVESTNQLTVPKTLTLNFETSPAEDAALRLEDILGLMFGPERKSFKLEILLPKGGPGKSVKAALQKILTEYGIKSISKLSALNVTVMSRSYFEMITTFRQNHSKEADDS